MNLREWRRRLRARYISPTVKAAVLARDGHNCRYCGWPVRLGARQRRKAFGGVRHAPDALVIDHVRPVAKGGGNTAANLVVACYACNAAKRDALMEPLSPP